MLTWNIFLFCPTWKVLYEQHLQTSGQMKTVGDDKTFDIENRCAKMIYNTDILENKELLLPIAPPSMQKLAILFR